ncbi:hypothetical protein Hanom_Chr17g01542771 [Helianthus anomalus]
MKQHLYWRLFYIVFVSDSPKHAPNLTFQTQSGQTFLLGMSSVPNWYRYRKNRYRKSSKVSTGTEYTLFGTVRYQYRYLRAKTSKYRYRTGTESAKSRYRIGTEKVPGSVNSVPVPGTNCSSLLPASL